MLGNRHVRAQGGERSGRRICLAGFLGGKLEISLLGTQGMDIMAELPSSVRGFWLGQFKEISDKLTLIPNRIVCP